MVFVKRSNRNSGSQLSQYLAGVCGAMITTLPSIIVIPLWFFIVKRYRLVDMDGNDDDFGCGAFCFILGMLIWVAAIVIFGWSR